MPIDVVIRYAVGGCIQFAPFAVLCYLPFTKERMRFSKRRMIILHCILLLVYAILESLLFVYLEFVVCVDDFRLITNLIRLFLVSISIMIYCMIVNDCLLKKVIVFILIYSYVEIITAFSTFAVVLIDIKIPGQEGSIYAGGGLFATWMATASTLPLMVLFMIKVLKEWLSIMTQKTVRTLGALTVLLAVIYGISYVFILVPGEFSVTNIILFTSLTIAVSLVYILFFSISFQSDEERKLREWADMANHQMKLEEIQYKNMIENIERARRIKHDVRHHLRMLRSMAAEGDDSKILEYLDKYEEKNFSQNYEKVCNNFIVNSITRFYFKDAREKAIEVTHKIFLNDDIGIDKVMLTTVFANMIENAIEACERCKKTRKYIDIKVTQLENMLIFVMENSCESIRYEPKNKNDRYLNIDDIFSSKLVGNKQGIGLSNVSEIVASSDGKARYRYEEGKFFTEICMGIIHKDIK